MLLDHPVPVARGCNYHFVPERKRCASFRIVNGSTSCPPNSSRRVPQRAKLTCFVPPRHVRCQCVRPAVLPSSPLIELMADRFLLSLPQSSSSPPQSLAHANVLSALPLVVPSLFPSPHAAYLPSSASLPFQSPRVTTTTSFSIPPLAGSRLPSRCLLPTSSNPAPLPCLACCSTIHAALA